MGQRQWGNSSGELTESPCINVAIIVIQKNLKFEFKFIEIIQKNKISKLSSSSLSAKILLLGFAA